MSFPPFLRGVDRRFTAARHWSNEQLRVLAPLARGDVVNVSAGTDNDKQGATYRSYFAAATSYTMTNTVGYRGFEGRPNELLLDLEQELPSALERAFDVVFNHTTLEHIFDVRRAFANLCAMARDAVIVIVPFAQTQHESTDFGDYWRFTPSALHALFASENMTVVYEAESPRRNSAIYLIAIGARDPAQWATQVPAHRALEEAGAWIGESTRTRVKRAILRQWFTRRRLRSRGS